MLPFSNTYVGLPERFFERREPTPVSAPALIRVNHALARNLGIDPAWLESEQGVAVIAGNTIPAEADPIATVYAGHQFGGFNPQLGDGRAILLGEVIASDGLRYDVQLKGAGQTAYSRGGDGRAPLGPVLREYIVSEAMSALGVPTSRTLAAVTTGDRVIRESYQPSGVLARVAQSHIRIGTFQFFAARKDTDALRLLRDYVIQRHYPQAADADNPTRALLDAVIARQAELVSQWQCLGFIHGVMNTDNMLISGETIDYGPCAFMDVFHPDTVFSSIDQGGRYAYGRQPEIAHWNLIRLAECLLPILDDDQDAALASGQAAIDAFPEQFTHAFRRGMGAKLGLSEVSDADDPLFTGLLTLMEQTEVDFTLTFRRLSDLAGEDPDPKGGVGDLFELPEAFAQWLDQWRERTAREPDAAEQRRRSMYAVNPVYIPRNHLVQETIEAAVEREDLTPFHELVDLLGRPYEYDPERSRYAIPPRPEQIVRQTFCGT